MKTRLTVLIMSLFLCNLSFSYAQAPDTVTVPSVINDVYLNVLPDYILGDTTATGERTNINRVYKLERGKVYLMNKRMYADDFSLKLIADDDASKCPPVIAPFPLDDGSIPRITIQVTKDAYFKNIYFQGAAPNDKRNTSDRPLAIGASNGVRITVESCIIDASVLSGVANSGSHSSVFIKDCLFRNDTYKYMFKGTMFYNYASAPMDTISIVNCTYFNGNSYALCNASQYAKFIRFEHNTLFINYNNPFYVPFASNADIKNNIFFSPASMGETNKERRDGYYDWDNQKLSVFSIDTIPSDMATTYGVTNENRRINFSHNAYYWPQQMKDFWAANDTVDAPVWMNERTLAFFNNNTQYPNLTAENNVEVDPGFNSAVMTLVDSVQQHMLAFRAKGAGVNVFYNPAGTALFPSRWPIPENLAYTNASLKTAGDDGLPLGDLNWFPEARELWEHIGVTDEGGAAIPEQYSLKQNYPNPFNPSTAIEFQLPKSGMVTLKVFDILGREVQTLVNQEMNAGLHRVNFNASILSSGVYLYRIEAGNFVSIKKMMLMK